MTTGLATWNGSPAKAAIVAFVEQTVAKDVPPQQRVAVFDTDGAEKATERAGASDWTTVSMKDGSTTMFAASDAQKTPPP